MMIENPEALKLWLTAALAPLCDADPVVLAKHVLALLNKENPESELRGAMCDELDVFLQQETKGFVDQLFVTLETKSYLQRSPTSRSRSRSPNRDRDRTARRSRDHATINNRRNDRSRSPPRRPSSRPPVVAPGFDLPPVGAPAQALIVPPPWFQRVQCAHFRDHSRCPRGDLCYYVTGPYQPDEDLWESLDMPGRDPPQNPQQPPLGNYQPPPPGSPPVVPTPETEFPDDQEHMFDQNATIKETDEDEDDLASEMINVEPATPTEEEGNNNGQSTDGLSGTQIIVTASTPMVENECFDPTDEKTSDVKENEMEQEFGEEMEPPPPPAPEPSTTETSSSSLDQPLPPPAPIADEAVVSKGFVDEFVQLETAKES
ncbi:pollen-specific leucine-rich repeat extensin-like protein 2 isoform X2 [Daphnia pulicaria]|uniref:pollen-specific leucine-rich repeat extensin-like protein 2 isoform X2 n=1 Tax=Daphnia pulicaria TaxID=35523 RepID=UPI001EEBA3B8|nr:pollen-specific leucine-rich repeat extensin-like protein 2 isoform X2 [Daphnia pulicaria]